MEGGLELPTKANEHMVFSVLADVVNSLGQPDIRVWGVRVSVNPSRFGIDEAYSILLRSKIGEGEIGKILVVPVGEGAYLFKIPIHQTGGAKMPELDPKGELFDEIVRQVLEGLYKRGLLDLPHDKGPLGFPLPEQGDAS